MENLKNKALGLPMQPGVYIMKDSDGVVIYVGKAKLLKNRVTSYFRGAHNEKTEAMIAKIADFDVIIASSEFEALMIENTLIKHYRPHYNILLRDDKGYPFIRIDLRQSYPRFTIVNRKDNEDGAKYFGPYGGRSTSKAAIDAVCKALKLPTCKKNLSKCRGQDRPCLNYHMNQCLGYCRPNVTEEEYRATIKQAIALFEGKTAPLIKELTQEMEQAAEALNFERAAEVRDRLRSIEALSTRQTVVAGSKADKDAVGFYRGETKTCMAVLHYIGGDLLFKDLCMIDTPMESDDEALLQMLTAYYTDRDVFPKNVLLPFELSDQQLLFELLNHRAEKAVYVTVPLRGEKRRMTETADKNAFEEVQRVTTKEERTRKVLELLRDMCALPTVPNRIEAYDISNSVGEDNVASMTVFKEGRPAKSLYRRFKMKTVEGQDDYASMYETICRRVKHFLSGDEKFSPLPDVFFIDGGDTHASTAERALRDMGIEDIPVLGMVKDDKHRTRALIRSDGAEIGIQSIPAVFAFVGSVQEETHRFAIEYHRKLQSDKVKKSSLDGISGVGEVRKHWLLKYFGSVKRIKEAELKELIKVVPENVARAIYDHYHLENKPEVAENESENTK